MSGLPDAETINAFGDLPITLAIIAVAILSMITISAVTIASFLAIGRTTRAYERMSEAVTDLKDETGKYRAKSQLDTESARADRERFANSTAQALAVLTTAQDTLMSQQKAWLNAFDVRDRQRGERLQSLIGGVGDSQKLAEKALDELVATIKDSHSNILAIQQQQHEESVSLLRELTTGLSEQLQQMRPEQAVTLAKDILVEFREGQKAVLAAIEEVRKQNERTHPPALAHGNAGAASGSPASLSPKRDTDRLAGGHA